jgi:menaquinol-cytochrome c reductase cytochrome b/c subunit
MSAAVPPQPRFREDVRTARAPAALDPAEKVYVWPHLLSIELVAALLYTLALSVMSILVNAPLEPMANPQHTPNPSKAPWYFLGLQELLLHMHPSLAGVIVPAAVLVGLAAMPYIDRERKGIAIWFSTPRGLAITLISAAYTTVWVLVLIFFDNWVGMRPLLSTFADEASRQVLQQCANGFAAGTWWLQTECGALQVRHSLGIPDAFQVPKVFIEWIIPILYMIFIPWTNVKLLEWRYGRLTTREVMICLYTYFFACFWVLIAIGTAFRGEGMKLFWPWQIPAFPE